MRKFLKELKIFFFIFLVLTLLLGFGLKALTSYANAQDFILSIDKSRWEQVRPPKFDNEAVTNSKVCTVGEKEGRDGESEVTCKGIKVSKFSELFDKRLGRDGTIPKLGEFLKWKENHQLFLPYSIRGVNFRGKWNIQQKPNLLTIEQGDQQASGDYFVVEFEGVPSPNIENCRYDQYEQREKCDDDTIWRKGDWAIWNGFNWQKISYTGKIGSLFGRGGEVKTETGDYTWNQINKTVSKVGDISDVSITDSEDEFILIYSQKDDNSLEWTPKKKKITTSMIVDNAVTTLKIKDGSINANFSGVESSLKDNSVNTSDLAKETVNSEEIEDDAVVTKSLKDNEIKEIHLNEKSVTNQKMQNLVAETSKIKNGSINEDKIKSNAIYTKHLISSAVTDSKIQNNSVESEQIKNASVSTDDLENNLMTNGNIPENSIEGSKIKGGTLVDADFSLSLSLKRSKLSSGSSNSIIYNDDTTGKLSEEKFVGIKRGGTGTDNTQDARNLLGIRPGFNTQKYHARLKDVVKMPISSESLFLGAKDYKLGMLTREEVRDTLEVSQIENLNVDESGNVGINNESPSKKLDVSGEVKFRDSLNMDNKLVKNVELTSINKGSVNSDECATLYEDYFYRGYQWHLCPGKAIPVGWKKLISSVKVPPGGELKLCETERETNCKTYGSNTQTPSLAADNDKASYFRYSFGDNIITNFYQKDLINKKTVDELLGGKNFSNTGLAYVSHITARSTNPMWSNCTSSKKDANTACGTICPSDKKCYSVKERFGFHGSSQCPNGTAPALRCRRMCKDNDLARAGKYPWGFFEHCGNYTDSKCIEYGCSKSKPEEPCRKTAQGTVFKFEFPRTYQHYCWRIQADNKAKVSNNKPIKVNRSVKLFNSSGDFHTKTMAVNYYSNSNSGGDAFTAFQFTASPEKNRLIKVRVQGLCHRFSLGESSKCDLALETKVDNTQTQVVAYTKTRVNSQFALEAYIQVYKKQRVKFAVLNKSGGDRYFSDISFVMVRLKNN